MSGVIASSVVKRVAGKLGDLAVEEGTLLWRFKDDVESMKEKMGDLEAVLQDADDKARHGEKDGAAAQRWLTKLKSVAYDVEDVLDELDAAELIQNNQPKLKLFFSRNNQLLKRTAIAHKMKNVQDKIDKIQKEVPMLGLMRREARAQGGTNNETFAAIIDEDIIGMVGRDAEKEKIMSLLLNTEAKEDISIIPIVGLGGLGKTTLAQAVLADKRLNIFDVRAWIYVSKDFDLMKIGKSVIKSVNNSINLDNCDLQFLQDNLKNELANRRYLIVLDDLWEENRDNLEKLKQMLQHGGKGSKIIATMRNGSVVQILRTGYLANEWKICPVLEPDHINLGVLSPDDCWKVLKRRVFGPEDDQSGLEEIGRQIAGKCGGLPLVANALGQIMSENMTIEAWEDIRDRKVVLDSNEYHQNDTLERLMLSYYYMKPDFKMCFTYLAVFSKGFVMDSDLLSQQWSALGYIQARHDGQKCINYLRGMSFLQISKSSSVSPVHARSPQNLTMHEGQSTPSRIVLPSSICQLMLLGYLDISGLPITVLPSFHLLQNMQTLMLSNCSLQTLPDNIGNLQKLCYLYLSGNRNLHKLPPSFTNLLKLSLLDLSGCTKLEELPESIHNLQCLQQLDMSECCALEKLPDKFGSLPKLSFVNLSNCSKLTKLPDNLYLESLEHLNLSSCQELENLPEDFGNLHRLEVLDMSDCYKVQVLPETFCKLTHLKDLSLSDCHALKQLPECFGHLSELHSLNMTSCSKIQSLPQSFCNMVKLKRLCLSYCIRLEELPSSFGDLKLQVLYLIGCYSLTSLPDSIGGMTSLTQLEAATGKISMCNMATKIKKRLNFSDRAVHNAQEIGNGECSSIVELGRLRCRELTVLQLENVEQPEDAERAKLNDMSELRDLNLSWGHDDMANAEKCKLVLQNLVPPRTLESFTLNGYISKDFPNWMSDISSYLPYLFNLMLHNLATCDSLPAFGRLPNLRSICMTDMPKIRKIGKEFYGEEGNCKKLRIIWLERMEKLEEWWTTRSGDEEEEFLIPNLHLLEVVNCPKLRFLPYPPRSMNWILQGSSNEVLPERGFGRISSSTLPFRVAIENCNFPLDTWGRLQNLSTLQIFEAYNCSGLRTLPDAIQCFTSLRILYLWSFGDQEILPEWLGQLVSLEEITFNNCPKLTSLPKSIQNLTALRELIMVECKELEILPQGLGQLISLQKLVIQDCPKLTCLPESMRNLTALKKLYLVRCEGLEILPEMIGHFTSLNIISIQGCPSLSYLPESTKKLTALEELWLEGFNGLPEWIGQFIYLKKVYILVCPKLTSLPKSIRNLTNLKELHIWRCPELVERCQREDANKISHIPIVILNERRFIPGQPIKGSESRQAHRQEEE